MASSWQAHLFAPNELIGFKREPGHKPTANEGSEFFCINPLLNYRDGASNANIAQHRNFLLESDTLSLRAQKVFLEDKMRVPFATKTFSGSKSYHYIIALEEAVSADKYAEYWSFLKYLLDGKIDPSCSNPSRLSRTPGVVRKSTGKKQRLVAVGKPISVSELEQWLYGGPNAGKWYTYNAIEVPRMQAERAKIAEEAGSGELAEWLRGFRADLVSEGKRHHVLMAMACSLVSTGYADREQFIVDKALLMGKNAEEALKVLYWAERKLAR